MSIMGNMIGSYSQLGKTFVIEDESGNELTGVVTSKEQLFDATVADVKIGKTFASDNGVEVGTDTKTYRTYQSIRLIRAGSAYTIPLNEYDQYDYTQLQCVIVLKNTGASDSFAADKVVLDNGVYQAGAIEKLATVTKNSDTKSIDLNLTNNTNAAQYIRFFTYKEE